MKNTYFKSSMLIAASGLTVGSGQAAVTVINHDQTLTFTATEGESISFDITGDAITDYRFVYANNNGSKPQITSDPFGGETYSQEQIMMPNPASKTLPADLGVGGTVDVSLYAGVSFREGFFFRNYDDYAFGEWGGPDTDTPVGPVEGYIGLRIETGGEASGLWNYGYAHVEIDVPGETMTVFETAYEGVQGQSITIVPEPSVAGLAAGAIGLATLRRRRRAHN